MASSRQMRRSRRASPLDISMNDSIPVSNEESFEHNHDDLSGDWVEPPLRAPVPSFEDYKGLERHGVLEHMAPLGSLPGSKVRARLRQHEPPRRAAPLKNGDLRAAKEEVSTPEPVPPVATRRSEPRKTEEKVARVLSSRERDEDQDYTPTLKSNTRVVPLRVTPMQPALHGTPSSRTAQGRVKLREIVDSAVKRSNELGDPVLGEAVKELYEESLHNTAVADLLDAVLTQKPSTQQTAEFQSRIRAARKKHREHHNGQDSGSKRASASRTANSSASRHLQSPKNPSNLPELTAQSPTPNPYSPEQASNTREANGTSTNADRPLKRLKRSQSTSSSSSLSSLDSAIDEEPPPTLKTNQVLDQKLHPSKALLPNGPRLGTFPLRPTDTSARRPILLHTNSIPSVDEAALKKREEMRRKFNQFVGVKDSAIRSSPSPLLSPQSTPPIAPFTEPNQQARLRNGVGQRRKKEDYDALDSPASSGFSDLLVPPPLGPSRGATPYQLGRPPKALKKVARIKMSPMKKRTATTAGRGAEGETSALSTGRTINTQSDGNSDVCTACSGDGKLVCCEGCSRAYHLTCCDPPNDKTPEDDFYCNKCAEDRAPHSPPSPGLFQGLVTDSFRKSTLSFALPLSLRHYYDGVTTGEDGEYEESGAVKTKRATRGGYEEAPDNFKIKDGKDNTIFCFRCSGSSLPTRQSNDVCAVTRTGREMIQCDYCNLSWHLECLDPPLAVAPKKSNKKGDKVPWMCPNHTDSILKNIDPKENVSNKNRPATGRTYKIRRPRNAIIVDTALRRGVQNNGLIEIIDEYSDDEALTLESPPQIPRIHEKSVKLDFIDRVKRANEERAHNVRLEREAEEAQKAAKLPAFNERPFIERKAALNLIQMANTTEAKINHDRMQNLIGTLIAEAPEKVGQLLAAEDDNKAAEVTEEERKDLETLIQLAQRRLAGGKAK